MALSNEELLAISQLLDGKLQPLKNELHETKMLIENDVLPRLNNLESCYTSTYRRYADGAEEIKSLKTDVEILKKVVTEHSEKLQRLA